MLDEILKLSGIINKVENSLREKETELFKSLNGKLRFYKIVPIVEEKPAPKPEPAPAPKIDNTLKINLLISGIINTLKAEKEYIFKNRLIDITDIDGTIFIENNQTRTNATLASYGQLEEYLLNIPELVLTEQKH